MIQLLPILLFVALVNSELTEVTGVETKTKDECVNCNQTTYCCIVWGDPHLLTYDGARLDFQGTCRYQLTAFCNCEMSTGRRPHFSVSVQNWRRGRSDRRGAWVRSVRVEIDRSTVDLMEGGVVQVNGMTKTLPYNSIPHAKILTATDGKTVRVETDFGYTIKFNGRSNTMVCRTVNNTNDVCGLCGNADGNSSNDYVTKQRDPLTYIKPHKARWAAIAASWRLPSDPGEVCDEEEVPEKPKVSNTWKTKAETVEYCGLIANKTGPFGRCIAAADQKKLMAYFAACVSDVVEVSDDPAHAHTVACSSLEALVDTCEENGVEPSDTWRGITKCDAKCPAGMTYQYSVTSCPNTCANRTASAKCRKPHRNACACPKGTVMSGSKCVAFDQCGCTDKDGTYHQLDEVWFSQDCNKKWRCMPGENGGYSKIRTEKGCARDETCKEVDGVVTCVPVPVKGNWSKYSAWSDCVTVEGIDGKIRMRVRSCDNPKPRNGGVCDGNSLDTQPCDEHNEYCKTEV